MSRGVLYDLNEAVTLCKSTSEKFSLYVRVGGSADAVKTKHLIGLDGKAINDFQYMDNVVFSAFSQADIYNKIDLSPKSLLGYIETGEIPNPVYDLCIRINHYLFQYLSAANNVPVEMTKSDMVEYVSFAKTVIETLEDKLESIIHLIRTYTEIDFKEIVAEFAKFIAESIKQDPDITEEAARTKLSYLVSSATNLVQRYRQDLEDINLSNLVPVFNVLVNFTTK